MPSNQSVQIMLGFQADTSNAKKAIQDLNAQLNKIQSFSIDNLRISNDLADAADAAKVLQQNLQGAMNFNTGQLNISQFAQNLQKAGTSVTELSQKLLNAGATGTQAFTSLSRAISAMDVPLKQTNSMINNMMTTLKNTAKWELSSNIVHGLESAFSSAISYAKSLNGALTDIRIVSGASVEQMAKFAVEANQAAKALGTTTKAYADAALIYYQQGDSAEMAAKKAEITLKATNAAFSANAQQMSEMLTATWNSYQAGADELEHMVDVMANLGAHTATSMEEIATSLQKVAATANTVGVSMEQMSAMISTVSSVTRQSAETIGTSMNTILSRIGGLKLGQTLEDGVDLNKYSKALASVGVQVLDAQGQLRSMGVVIDELGEKWGQLSTAQQSALAQTVGGTRQYTSLMALFSNWDKYKENFDLAQNADGALQKMQDTYLESWEGASQRLKASIEGIWSELIDDQGMIEFTNSITKVVEQVQNLIQSFGGVPGILTQIGAIAVQVFSKNIAQGITSSITSIKTFVNSFKGLQLIDSKTGKQLQGKDYATKALSMTTNERIYNQTANQALDQMGQARGKEENNFVLQSQIDASQTLLEKKLQLQQVENDMSVAQKLNAQAQIAGLTAQSEQIQKLSQEYEDVNKELEKQERSITTISELQAAAQSKKIGEITETSSATDVRKAMSDAAIKSMLMAHTLNVNELDQGKLFADFDYGKIEKANTGVETLISRFRTLNQVETDIETTNAAFVNALNTSTQELPNNLQNLTDRLNELKTNLQNKGADTTWVDKLSAKLKTAADSNDSDKLSQAVQKISISLDEMGQKVHMSADTAFNILSNTLGISSEKLRAVADSANLSEEQMIRLSQAVTQMQNSSKNMNFSISNMQKAIGDMTKAAGAMAGAFSSAFNLLENWDSANAASKITGVVSTITQGVNAIFSGAKLGSQVGGIWGAVIGAGVGLASTAIGAITGNQERQRKVAETEYQDAIKAAANVKTNVDEENSAKSLLNTYNELYNKQKEGEPLQAELIEVASKLAEAYNITGASVALLSGNIKEFNENLRDSIDLQAEIDDATLQRNAQGAILQAGLSKDRGGKTLNTSQFYDARPTGGSQSNVEEVLSSITDWEHGGKQVLAALAGSETSSTMNSNPDVNQAIRAVLGTGGLNLDNQINGWAWLDAFGEELIGKLHEYVLNHADKFLGDQGYLTSTNNANKMADELASVFTYFGSPTALGMDAAGWSGFFDLVLDGKTMNMSAEYTRTTDGSKFNLSNVFTQWYQDKGANFFGGYFQDWADNLLTEATGQEVTSLGHTWTNRAEELGILNPKEFSQMTQQEMSDYVLRVNTFYEEINAAIEDMANSMTPKLLESNEDYQYLLKLRTEAKKVAGDSNLVDAAKQYAVYNDEINLLEGVKENISSLIGASTTDIGGLQGFSQKWEQISDYLDKNKDKFSTLKDLPIDSDEYIAAKNKIISSLIKDYTDFDDYVDLYQTIAQQIFGENAEQVMELIDTKGWSDIDQVSKFIPAIQQVLALRADDVEWDGNLSNLDIFNRLEEEEEARTRGAESLDRYNQALAAQSSVKSKNMTVEDYEAIAEAYKDFEGFDFQIFVDKGDYDSRMAYLQTFTDSYLAQAQADQEVIITAARATKDAWEHEMDNFAIDAGFTKDNGDGTVSVDREGLQAAYTRDQALYNTWKNSLETKSAKDEAGDAWDEAQAWQDYLDSLPGTDLHLTIAQLNAYHDALARGDSYTEAVASAERSGQALKAVGSEAETAATKVSKLASAFNSLPKSKEEAEDLLKIFRENKIGGQWQLPTMEDIDTLSPTELLPQYIPMTAEELANLSQEQLNDYMIQAAKKELEDITDPLKKKQAESEIRAMEKTQRDLITTDEKQRLSELSSEYQSLSKIDITKMPKEGTSAYKALQQALKSVNIEMSKFNNMSDMDKNAVFYKAQRQSLQEQLTTAQQIADVYNTHDFTVGMDLSGKDADFIKEYQDWYNLYKQVIDLENQISDSFTSETDSRIAILSKEAEAIEKRMTNSQKEADKIQKQAEIFSNAVETGDLTATQKVNLTDADITKWNSLTTAEERAAFAAQKWSEALIAGQDAFSETQGLITNAQTMMYGIANEFNVSQVYASTVGQQKISKDFASRFNNPMIAKAYQAAVDKGTIKEGTTTQIQGIQAIIVELQTMGEEGQKSQKLIEAAGIDAMNNIYKTAVEKEQAAAQEAIQAWKEAYDTIADIRKSLYNKEDIGEIFLDPDKSAALAKSLGVSVQEAYGMYLNGSIKPENLKQNSFDINAAIQQRALSTFGFANTASGRDFNKFRERYFAQNKTTGQTIDDFYDQHTDALLRLGQDYFKGFDQFFGLAPDAWKDYFNAIIKGTVTEDMQTTLQKWNETVAQGILVQEKAYKMQDDITAAEQERDALIKESTKTQQEAETKASEYSDLASIARSIFSGNGENLAASYLNGQDANKVLDELNNALGSEYKNIEEVSLVDWGKAADKWSSLSATETEKAAEASEAIVEFWNQFIENLKSLGASSTIIAQAEEARDTANITATSMREEANAAKQDSEYKSLEQWSNYAGVNEKEFVKLAQAFEDLDKNTKILKEDTDEYRQLLYQLTAMAKRSAQGAEEIGKHYKKNKQEIESLIKATGDLTDEQRETIDTMRNNLSKAFNAEKKYLDDDFIKKHAKDYKELAEGSEEAAKRIQKALTEQISKNFKKEKIKIDAEIDIDGKVDGLTTVQDTIDSFLKQYENAPIGLNIDTGPALEALNFLISSGAAAATDLQSYFDMVGYYPDVQLKYFELKNTTPVNGQIMYDVVDPVTGEKRQVPANIKGAIYGENGIWLPQIGNISKVSTAKQVASNSSSGSKGGGGGGGGGGGSQIKHKEYKDGSEVERYHTVNRQIEYQERLLKKVNLLKNQRYGLGYLSALKKENAELLKSIDLTRRRAGPTHAGYWLEHDKAILAENGGTFDEITGNLWYQPYMFGRLDDYNRHVDEYNARADAINAGLSSETQEQLDEWFDDYEKEWQKTIDAIDGYEEALDIILDAEVDVMEKLNEISANLKEISTYKMEFRMELNEADMKRIDFLIKRYGDYLDLQDESFEQMEKNANFLMENLSYVEESFEELYGYYHTKLQVFDKEAEYIDSLDNVDDLLADDMRLLNDADYVDGLFTTRDALMENVEQLWELRKQMLEVYGNTIDLAADKLSKFTDTLEHHINVYDSYLEILELTQDGIHFDEDIQILQGAYNSALTEVNILREHLDALLGQRETLLKQMENPIYANNEKIQKDFEALQTRIEEIEDQLLETTQTTLDKAKVMFDKTLEHAQYKMRKLGDSFSTDLDWLSTQWDFWIAEQDQYVDRITQVYEIDKLVRDIENAIADTRNKSNQAELKALEDEIQLRSENNALTEYDIEMMRLSYELLLAKQNLENAQDAKDTVRLTRDDNGNYIYQYTADEDKVAEAQQKYNDVLYEMNQTTKERYRELVQSGIDIQREFIDQYTQIMEDMTLSTQEKEQRVQELFEHYGNLLEGIDIQMDNVLRNMGENQLAWTNEMGINLMDTADTAAENISNLTGNTRTQLNLLFNDARTDAETWKTAILEIINEVSKSWSNYCSQLTTVQDTSKTTLDDMIKQIIEYGKQANVAQDQASILTKTMDDTLTTLAKMNAEWLVMDTRMQSVIDSMLKMDEKMSEEQREVAGKEYDDWVQPNPGDYQEMEYLPPEEPAAAPAGGGSTCQTSCGTGCTGSCWKANASGGTTYWVQTGTQGATVSTTAPTGQNTTGNSTSAWVQMTESQVQQLQENQNASWKVGFTTSALAAQFCQNQCGSGCESGCLGGCDNSCKNGCKETCTGGCDNSCGSAGANANNTHGVQVNHIYATGGLNDTTGWAWIDGTPDRPEYVLNAEQTQEMFGILNDHTVSNLLNTMTMATQAMLAGLGLTAGNISTSSLTNTANAQNNTYITAEFPNATDHNEIELALENLMNSTAQSVNSLLS